MAVSAVGFALIVSEIGGRTDVLMLARDVPAGHVIRPTDLRIVEVAAETGVVPLAHRGTVLGKRAQIPLTKGALLSSGQVGERSEFPPKGLSQVAVAVEAGGAPPDVTRGDRVALVAGPDASGGTDDGDDAKGASSVVGTVTGVRAAESAGGPRVVSVLVETAAANRAAQLERPRVVVLSVQGREAP
ncbi:SAF domain-containing protein [Streptomyces sp. NBC_00006]|uniref:SAF domain-containing protein n=1 Tax=unclassified Streptomyces TaxID=2593676 RepID=UPI0022583188|nr:MULTISPECIES: SAF domain-containing protein [unclassified Streptomyces]MCX5535740.1 SAF domain-containing protein [Streptomyces sp. NBC_00006]